MIEERSLLLSVKAGSEKAYYTLYKMWVSRLYRFVYQYLKSEDATDDIVQETFCRIWTNREKLNPDSSFKAYLFTIAYHFLIKELRRQLNNTSMEEFIEYHEHMRISGEDTDKDIDFDQFCRALQKAKDALSPRQREIFELNKEYNLSVAEIAEHLSIKEQVVRNQLSIALKIIRTELQQYSFILLLFLYKF
jgi:RNA polymerase sigma-70 factor (family 1)